MGRGSKKFVSKFVEKREEKFKVVQPTAEQKAENIKQLERKQKRKAKQERLDIDFERSGISQKEIDDSPMDKAEVKRLIRRANDNGVEQSDVKDQIDFDTTFENNVRKNPIFADSLKDFRKSDELTQGEQEWAEDYYLIKAEENPKKAIKDSSREDKPVRRQIKKGWIKAPFSKKGGDIEGIDDGSDPLTEEDFE